MAIQFTNKKQDRVSRIRIVSRDTSNISIEGAKVNNSTVLDPSAKKIDFELLPLNEKYQGVIQNNSIINSSSFETKALGESLYTNSNIITGGSIPFTIEFYALIKDTQPFLDTFHETILSFSHNRINSFEGIYVDKLNRIIHMYNTDMVDSQNSGVKLNKCEVNKINLSYDGAALRLFINDKLHQIYGTTKGVKEVYDNIKFLSISNNTDLSNTLGIIDNINIHDGIATKVRDHDPYEEYLVVDLAFDGENNSTKIVDNAYNGQVVKDPYWNKTISLLDFESNLEDRVNNTWTGTPLYETIAPLFGTKSLRINTETNAITSAWKQEYSMEDKDFTIELTLKYEGVVGSYPGIMSSRSYGSAGNNWALLLTSDKKVSFNCETLATVTSNITLIENTKYHIAVTRKDKILRLFINGKKESETILTNLTMRSLAVPLNIGRLDGPSQSNNVVKGVYDEIRITKGFARYTENFTPHTEPFEYKKQDRWVVNGNAKISTDQKFDGFSSVYLDGTNSYLTSTYNNYDIEDKDFTIKCSIRLSSIKNTDNVILDAMTNTSAIGWQLYVNSTGNLVFYDRATTINGSKIVLKSTKILAINTIYDFTITRENNSFKMYIDGILENTNTGYINFGTSIPINIGAQVNSRNTNYDFNGYIKNFKIYKGVAVIPEDPTGKIQLDFDNNVIDKYGNSTWTNNGVTFDQVNSVKGSAAKFGGGQIVTSGQNSNLNFEDKNFYYSLDLKSNRYAYPYDGSGILSNNYTSNQSHPERHALVHSNTNGALYSTNGASNGYVSHNTFYNILQGRINSIAYAKTNGVLTGVKNILPTTTYNYNYGNNTFIGLAAYYHTLTFDGYIDNFKSIKDYQGDIVIDRPAVHLPLETNATNIGFSQLTINSVGSPTYTTIDGKKCIKFESGKYLTINSNNIFNLGTNSDFYIEFDFYILGYTSHWQRILEFNDAIGARVEYRANTSGDIYAFGTKVFTPEYKRWYNLKIFRKGVLINILLDDVKTSETQMDITSNPPTIGTGEASHRRGDTLNGYMSNFKMFVGTHEPPETYNDKKVLDLDFAPPLNEDGNRASYLFKDNNNKCVIHPVKMDYRDYQDGQYCATFNGVDQYLQLGKNDALNFGLDDFILHIDFTCYDLTKDFSFLLGGSWNNNQAKRAYIGVGGNNRTDNVREKFAFDISNNNSEQRLVSESKIEVGIRYKITLVAKEKILYLYFNNNLQTNTTNILTPIDFNFGSNTSIACNYNLNSGISNFFNGTIYSIKILRNTSDLSLLGIDSGYSSHFPFKNNLKDVVDSQEPIQSDAKLKYNPDKGERTLGFKSGNKVRLGVKPSFSFGAKTDFLLGLTYKRLNFKETNTYYLLSSGTANSTHSLRLQKSGENLQLMSSNSSVISCNIPETPHWLKIEANRMNNIVNIFCNGSHIKETVLTDSRRRETDQYNLNLGNSTDILSGTSTPFIGEVEEVYSKKGVSIGKDISYLPSVYLPLKESAINLGIDKRVGSPSTYTNITLTEVETLNEKGETIKTQAAEIVLEASPSGRFSENIILSESFSLSFDLLVREDSFYEEVGGFHSNSVFGVGDIVSVRIATGVYKEHYLVLSAIGSNEVRINFKNEWKNKWINITVEREDNGPAIFKLNEEIIAEIEEGPHSVSYYYDTTIYLGTGVPGSSSNTSGRKIWIKEVSIYRGSPYKKKKKLTSTLTKMNPTRGIRPSEKILLKDNEGRFFYNLSEDLKDNSFVSVEERDCIEVFTDSSIEVREDSLLQLDNSSFSISFDIYPTDTKTEYQNILNNITSNNSYKFSIQYNPLSGVIQVLNRTNIVGSFDGIIPYNWNRVVIMKRSDGSLQANINSETKEGVSSIDNAINLAHGGSLILGKKSEQEVGFEGYFGNFFIIVNDSTLGTALKEFQKDSSGPSTEIIAIKNPPKDIEYPIEDIMLDEYGVEWVQGHSSNKVTYKEISEGQLGFSFNRINNLVCNNRSTRYGLEPFTVEFDFKLRAYSTHSSYWSHIFSYSLVDYTDTFSLAVSSTGVINFRVYNTYIPLGFTLSLNRKYRIAIERDKDYNLHLYVDGEKVSTTKINSNLGGTIYSTEDREENFKLVLGKHSAYTTSNNLYYGIDGIISNISFQSGNKIGGVERYIVKPYDPTPRYNSRKVLLQVDQTVPENISTIQDYNNLISWSAINVKSIKYINTLLFDREYSLDFNTINNRITSESGFFDLKNENFTLDLILTTKQTSSSAVILDTRPSSTVYKGLTIYQPQSNTSSIEVGIGSKDSKNGGDFEFKLNTGNASIVPNETYHIRLIRDYNKIRLFLNGSLRGTIEISNLEIGESSKIILGNDDTNNKGFNGYITQFRLLKGTVSTYFPFSKITKELK